MQDIDGSGGGGQIVRTAVTLSALSGEAVRIENVRENRSSPGLRAQHLAAIEAAAALCDATTEGDEHGSETVVFRPGEVRAADVTVDVGTAGSVSLILDTILPLATVLEESATVTTIGGTDVEWSPPVDYLRYVKLPLLAEVGLDVDCVVTARGFYPVGGGEVRLELEPSSIGALSITRRGPLQQVDVYSIADSRLREADVAERQASAAIEQLPAAVSTTSETTYVEADCPGSSLVLVADYEASRAGFTAIGKAGKPSESVAADAVAKFERFHDGTGAVDRHLADQLMLYVALAGGRLLAPELTDHIETNRAVIEAFGHELSLHERKGDGAVSIEPR